MEDTSPIYEQVDIRKWAQDIREMKICELQKTITEYKEILKSEATNYSTPERYISIIQGEIDNLKARIEILKRK
jgi:hypothetical protein